MRGENQETDSKGYIQHALKEEGETSMTHLLEPHTRWETDGKHHSGKPDNGAIGQLTAAYALCYVYAKKEYRDTAPEYLYMADSCMDGRDILDYDTPHKGQDYKPAHDWMTADCLHIRGRKDIKHHSGGDIPECQLVMQPEIPVDEDIAGKVNERRKATGWPFQKTWKIEERRHDKPSGIDTAEASGIEVKPASGE